MSLSRQSSESSMDTEETSSVSKEDFIKLQEQYVQEFTSYIKCSDCSEEIKIEYLDGAPTTHFNCMSVFTDGSLQNAAQGTLDELVGNAKCMREKLPEFTAEALQAIVNLKTVAKALLIFHFLDTSDKPVPDGVSIPLNLPGMYQEAVKKAAYVTAALKSVYYAYVDSIDANSDITDTNLNNTECLESFIQCVLSPIIIMQYRGYIKGLDYEIKLFDEAFAQDMEKFFAYVMVVAGSD